MTFRPEIKTCPAQGTPFLYCDMQSERKRIIKRATCKLWSCEYCKHINAQRNYIRILDGSNGILNKGRHVTFFTITSHEKLRSAEQCLYVWRRAWRKLRERIYRLYKRLAQPKFSFAIITEKHKDGRLHWHGVCNDDLPSRWLRDNARSCGLGYESESERVDNVGRVSSYVTKYMSKSIAEANYPKKMRRIVYSRTWGHPEVVDSTLEWHVCPPKKSLVDLIKYGWYTLDFDVELDGQKVLEIVDND